MCDDADSKSKNLNKINIVVQPSCLKRLVFGIHCFSISICDSKYQFNDSANQQKKGTAHLQGVNSKNYNI